MEAAQLAELPHLTCRHLAVCPNGYPELKVSEKRGGDVRVFRLVCRTCQAECGHWETMPGTVQTSAGDLVEANIRLVGGCLATGTGYEDLRKLQGKFRTYIFLAL